MSPGTAFSMAKDTLRNGTRRAFAASATAAVMAFSTAVVPMVAMTVSAKADQVSVLKGKIRALETHTRAMQKQARDADARGAVADKRGAAADKQAAADIATTGCINFLVGKIKAGEVAKADVVKKLAGRPITVGCKDVAPDFGYRT